ncbi:MAG: endo-1,4-beta-xylanase [Phycisphaerales bacterium]|nr:endo-1,4-beta-xylanase [Phycisphaerales bacterium]
MADDGAIESFDHPAAFERDWSFSNGPEWPGAVGSLERRDTGGRTGDGVLALKHDFSGGGSYVAALVAMPADRKVAAVRMWLNKPGGNNMIIRCVDAKGETFQKDLRYEYPGWQAVEVLIGDWVYSWGGDGAFDEPAKQLDILIQPDGGKLVGELLIDDLTWVTDANATPAKTGSLARTTYRESDFRTGDPWTPQGPADSTFTDGTWSYRFDDDHDACGLGYGRSILGKPQTLLLTVESDATGHELTAMCGSHFQFFHKTLGKLDKRGEQNFEVELGDMHTWRYEGGENDGIVRYPLRLENIGVRRADGDSASGTIKLKSLRFVTDYSPDQRVIVQPTVTAVDDGNVRFDIRIRSLLNMGPTQTFPSQLTYTIGSFDRTLREGVVYLDAPDADRDQTCSLYCPFGDATMLAGCFTFSTGIHNEIASTPVTVTIARADTANIDATLDPASRMGVGMYLYRFHDNPEAKAWMTKMCQLANAAGVKWTREEFHWNWIEKTKGEFDFSFFDQLVDTATEHGISVYGLMCYWTEWTGQPMTEEFIEPYCNYLRTVVGRYKDRIHHWEIWNEPNIFFWPGPKELYAKLCIAAYHAIKETDPDAQVLICSTAGIDTKFIKLVLEHDPPFDAITVHPYRHALDPRGFINELQDTSKLAGGKDVWITEMGWPSNIGGLTEREQAGYVARTYVSALAAPATRTVAWYDFREDGTDPFYNEHHFGLIRQDLTPKIGYRALAAVGTLLGNAKFEKSLDLGSDIVAFAFRDGERRIVALWPSDRTRLIGLKFDGTTPKILNAMAEPANVTEDRGLSVLRMEHNLPVYLVSDGEFSIAAKDWPVVLAPAQAAYHPGDTVTISATMQDAMTSVRIDTIPPGWTMTTNEMPAMINVPEDAAPGDYEITFSAGTMGMQQYRLPVQVKIAPTLVRG